MKMISRTNAMPLSVWFVDDVSSWRIAEIVAENSMNWFTSSYRSLRRYAWGLNWRWDGQ